VKLLTAGALIAAFGFLVASVLAPESGSASLSSDDLDSLAEDVIDEFVDTGLLRQAVRYDDPLLTQQRTILITGGVNSRLAEVVVSKLLYLDALDSTAPIELYVRTHGGWGDDAHAICDVIERIDAPVNTWAIGACRSAGTLILAAGTGTRRALPQSLITIHITEESGNEARSKALASRRRKERFWRARAKLPEDFYPMDCEKSYYLSAEEALKYGIIDEIYRAKKK